MMKLPWRTIGIVVAVVVLVNLASYFIARRALAMDAVPSDGGPTR